MLSKFIGAIKHGISRPLQYYHDICVRCGACAGACHFHSYSRDPAHIPAYRMMLVKKLLHYSKSPFLNWHRDFLGIDEKYTAELKRALWECTGCRRCSVFCPFNLDTGLLVSNGRYALLEEKMGPEIIAEIGNAEVAKGEIIDSIKEFYVGQVREIEARLKKEFAPEITIPVEKKGARVLYVPLVGEHSIIPVAKIFHAAREDWTLSFFTATNHSFFVGNITGAKKAASWIIAEAHRLGVKAIAYPECGHATRILLQFYDRWFKDEIKDIRLASVVQLAAEYLKAGRIGLRPNAFDTTLTYHDPCNFGRNAGIFEEPRILLGSVAKDFRELRPGREYNWCCGGGSGLIAVEEMKETRMKAGLKKVEQIKASGCRWVATACENCKTQLADLNEHYNLGVEIKGVTDLVADALV